MKALRFYTFGDFSNLKVEEVPEAPLGPDEVRVRIRAASINPSDANNIEGRMEGTTLPRTPGRDFSGIVVDGPAHLRDVEVWGTGGDIGFTRDGSHAESIVIPADAAAPKPANLSFEEAAAAGLNYVTAYEGLANRAGVKAGETVLVTGAMGGVGQAVLRLGQALGAKLISADRKPFDGGIYEGLELLGHIDTSRQNLRDGVLGFTAGKGVDLAFDCVGGELFEPVLSSLAHLGRNIVITSIGTNRVSFDLRDFYHHRLSLIGVDSRALTVTDSARILNSIAALFVDGRLRPLEIAKRGSLQEARELYFYVKNSRGGKAVFVFN
ncbi:MAG TPA: zinc-binding dehydrogenase [Terracidiphilus sp.]|jgi:NADPH:quinone reductase-like Zn-dependent oxidoreductase